MTYLEKAKKIYPQMTDEEIFEFCPEEILILPKVKSCPIWEGCIECWNREMPEVKE